MGKNGELSIKQIKTIQALFISRNIEDACKKANIGRSTLARWLKQPEFVATLETVQGEYLSDISRELLFGQKQALDTLFELMKEGNSENVRRQAANSWLSFALKYKELVEFENRIKKLENSFEKQANNQ